MGEFLSEGLPKLERGELRAVPQDASKSTLAPMLKREDARLDWRLSAQELHDRIRAFQPWPGASCTLPDGAGLKISASVVVEGAGPAGTVLVADRGGLAIATGAGVLRLLEVQPEGRRRMPAADFLAGHPLEVGTKLPG